MSAPSEIALSDRLLQATIETEVSRRLGAYAQELNRLTDGMNVADAKKARETFIEMLDIATEKFVTEAKKRLAAKQPLSA